MAKTHVLHAKDLRRGDRIPEAWPVKETLVVKDVTPGAGEDDPTDFTATSTKDGRLVGITAEADRTFVISRG